MNLESQDNTESPPVHVMEPVREVAPDRVADIDRKTINQRWQAVLTIDPECVLALTQLASNHLAANNLAKTAYYIERLERCSKFKPSQRYYVLRARYSTLVGNDDSTIEHWKSAMDHGYDFASGHLHIVYRQLGLGDLSMARQHIDLAVANGASPERVLLLKARCYMIELNWGAAIDILEDLEAFVSQRAAASKMLLRCYMQDQRNESASRLCRLLEQDDHADSFHLHGQLMFRKNQFSEALEKFRKAIDLDDNIESKIWLIKTLTSINDEQEVLAQIKLVEQTSSASALVQGRCWEAAGVLSKCEHFYEQAIEVDADANSYHALVRFYHTYRQWDKSYLMYLKAKQANVESHLLDKIAAKIEKGYGLRHRKLPMLKLPIGRREFRSSEEMVSGIVDRILKRRQHKTELNASRSVQNIVLVIGSLGPGGAERQVVNLANGLVMSHANITVNLLCTHLNRKQQDRFYESQLDPRVRVTEYFDKRQLLEPSDVGAVSEFAEFLDLMQPESRRQAILHMARVIDAINPDVVHGWLDETFVNTSLVCGMLGISNSVGRWGSMPAGVNRTVSDKDKNNIEYLNHAYRQIARIPGVKYSSNSRLTGDAYACLLGISADDVNIVYNGVDQESLAQQIDVAPDIRSEYCIPADAKVVGTVFRISEEKRPELWVQVAERISRDEPETHFVVVGSGPLESTMQAMVDEKSLVNFHMVGKQENVGAWYALFDVLLLTSRVEGVSNAVVESQLCGCPVVAPDVGGLSEAILDDESGFLLSDHSVDSFASSVRKILTDDKRRSRMSEAATAFAEDKFSIQQMVASYYQLFQCRA